MMRGKRTLSGLSLLCLIFLSMTGLGLAQSTTQGAIGGTVEDQTGAAVPQAIVTIVNEGTNATVKEKTDGSGYFQAPLLEPGSYKVTVNASGFGPFVASHVVVQVGQMTAVAPHLSAGATSETVEVTAETPVLNFEAPDFSSNLNTKALQDVPINNRRWSALAMTTPGVVSDSNGYGLVSVRGISPILNNVLIDGADDNQAYYAEERGRTREAYSTSENAVREFAVNTGVYQAEYGRAAGAVINSVTKSGTNEFHGEAYFFDRESKWNAYNDFSKLTPVTSNASGGFTVGASQPLKPEDMRKIYGFTAGGALIKDKLFWMYTFDQHHRIFPGIAVPDSPSTFYTLPNATLPNNVSCANTGNGYLTNPTVSGTATDTNPVDAQVCLLAARQKVSYAQAVTDWDNGVAGLNSDLGEVPRFGDQEINTPKLDWQINDKEHLAVLYHRLRWDSPGGVQTTGTDDYGVDTWGNDFVKLDYGVAKLTSLLSTHISNELLYQYSRELDDETQQPYSAYTNKYLTGTGGNVPEVGVDTSVFGNIGSPYYSYRKALPDERKWQVDDVLHYAWGNHNFTFGGDALHNYDLINNTYESNGDFSYSYLGNYFNDLLNEGTSNSTCGSQTGEDPTSASATGWTGTAPCYADFYQGFGNPVFAISTLDWSGFAQDNWKVSNRLTLELGLRYDDEILPAPSANLTTATGSFVPYPQLTNHPSNPSNIGPRIGFSLDAFGDGKTVLRGGYGIFYGRITNGVLLNVLLNTGSPNGQYTTTYKPSYFCNGTTAPCTGSNTLAGSGPLLPNIVGSGAAPTPSSYFLASNLKNPEVHEFDMMVQQQLGRGTVFQVSYLGALGRRLPNFLDLNLNPTTENVTITIDPATNGGTNCGPLACGTQFVVPTFTSYGNTAIFGTAATKYQSITEVTSNVNSSYNAFVAEIQNRTLHNLEFDFNYTWSHALDFSQNATTTTTANSWYNPFGDYRINYGNSSYNVPNRFTGYALYRLPGLQSGAWYHYLTNGWNVDTSFQMQNGLPYSVEASGYTGPAIGNYWNGSSGQEFIPVIGPNTLQTPRKIVDDARLEKDFQFRERYNWQFFVNLFNVANHQNIDGISAVAYKLAGSGTAGTATYQTTYQQVTSSNNSGFLYTPREIEIATRFNW